MLKRWKSRTPALAGSQVHHVDATEGELAALDAAVKRDA
jgi:hypothetical protein